MKFWLAYPTTLPAFRFHSKGLKVRINPLMTVGAKSRVSILEEEMETAVNPLFRAVKWKKQARVRILKTRLKRLMQKGYHFTQKNVFNEM